MAASSRFRHAAEEKVWGGGVLEQVQQQTGEAKTEFELGRFLDETIIDELEREGFFKKIIRDSQK